MTKKIILLCLIVISYPIHSQAQAISLNGMSLKIIPKTDESNDLAAKTAQVQTTERGLKVLWYSLVKEKDEQAYFPTYKIKAKRGMIETDGLKLKMAFFQPCIWGDGYLRTETALPLWIDPEYLNLKGRQKRMFNIGLLNNNKFLLKQAPDNLFELLSYFQNLYDQYVVGNDVRTDIKLSKRTERELDEFVKEFFLVRSIAKTKATLLVNNVSEQYPARMIGNDYYTMTVIDDPINPLVVNFQIYPDKVPKVFRKSFEKFKTNFEFMVSQIDY